MSNRTKQEWIERERRVKELKMNKRNRNNRNGVVRWRKERPYERGEDGSGRERGDELKMRKKEAGGYRSAAIVFATGGRKVNK